MRLASFLSVFALACSSDSDGVRIHRGFVDDIDHPGNVVGTIGLALTLLGALEYASLSHEVFGATFALAGAPLALYGLAVRGTSRSRGGAGAATRPESRHARLTSFITHALAGALGGLHVAF